MSIRVMTMVWDSDVPAPERMTLLALADWADDEGGNIFPRIGRLAWKCQAGERTVIRHLKTLESWGLLSRRRRYNDSSLYVIDVSALSARPAGPMPVKDLPEEPETDDANLAHANLAHAKSTPLTCQSGTSRGANMATYTSVEPSLEPEPPYPPDKSGGTVDLEQEPQQPAPGAPCSAHGRRSCRPCGTSPRAQERAAAAEEASADATARERTRACRMCNPDGWRHDPGTRVPVTPWVRCDHTTDHAVVIAEVAAREPQDPPAAAVPTPPAGRPVSRRRPRLLQTRGTTESRAAARAELDASREGTPA